MEAKSIGAEHRNSSGKEENAEQLTPHWNCQLHQITSVSMIKFSSIALFRKATAIWFVSHYKPDFNLDVKIL